jgi:hypothetical protein
MAHQSLVWFLHNIYLCNDRFDNNEEIRTFPFVRPLLRDPDECVDDTDWLSRLDGCPGAEGGGGVAISVMWVDYPGAVG